MRSGRQRTTRAKVAVAAFALACMVGVTATLAACAEEPLEEPSASENVEAASKDNASYLPVPETIEKVTRSEEEWKSVLPADRYNILRQKGTEPPFRNEFDDHWEEGTYVCYACGLPLFSSAAKFHSGTGWPSFWQPVSPKVIEEHPDNSYGMIRVEVTCARCGGHLGHVFEDGPDPTGLRYCINSASLEFVPR